jgi:hypothetical protein
MRVAVVSVLLVAAVVSYGCGSSGSCTTGCGGAGGAAGIGGGGHAGGAAGIGGGGHAGGAGVGSAGAAGSAEGGAAGAGGPGGHAGSSAGAGGLGGGGAGGAVGGNGGGAAGTAGGGGGNGGAAACGEPASCEGYDNNPDAHLTAEITCLSPSSAAANAAFTLAVFGHHLATGPTDFAIVTVGGVPLNGVPASACHLDVAVPASTIASPGQVAVVVSPGGWTLSSAAATLTVH